MKFCANHSELLPLAKMLAAAVNKRSVLPALRCIRLEADSAQDTVVFTATNLEMTLQLRHKCAVAESGDCLLPADSWLSILSLCSKDLQVLTVSADGSGITVQNGRTLYNFAAMPPENYPRPQFEQPESLTELGNLLPLAAQTTKCAALPDNSNPVLHCVHLRLADGKFRAECTDGYRAAWVEQEIASTNSFDLLPGAETLKTLVSIWGRNTPCKIGKAGKFLLALGPGMIFAARLTEGKYPDLGRITTRLSPEYRAKLPADGFLLAVRSAMVKGNKKILLRLKFGDHKLCLQSDNGCTDNALAKSQVEVPAEVETLTPEKGFLYSCHHIQDSLRNLGKGELTLEIDWLGYLHLRAGQIEQMILPCREPSRQAKQIVKKAAKKSAA